MTKANTIWKRSVTSAQFEHELQDLFDRVERMPPSIAPDTLHRELYEIIRKFNALEEH